MQVFFLYFLCRQKVRTIFAILLYMKKLLLYTLAALALAGCKHYQTIPVTLPDGFVVQALAADTPAKQEHGLMYVTHLPENQGMLFLFEREGQQLFWMKNTLIDLDIVFIGADKKVTHVAANVPRSTTSTPDDEVALAPGFGQYVLELAATTAAKHRVKPGSQLHF